MTSSSSELASLRPSKHRRVLDVVRDAGVDVTEWENSPSGAANPKFCYEWSFVQPGKLVVLNVWYDEISEGNGAITISDNLRANAALHSRGRSGSNTTWRRRAAKYDAAVQTAVIERLPIRIAICDGERREWSDLDATSSRVKARLLDPVPWAVDSYDLETGQFTLRRGAPPGQFVDQFSVGHAPESPTEVRSVTGEVFVRDPVVRAHALERADGRCEWCQQPGFKTPSGSPFLESHHIVPLSEDGPDSTSNVVALCPTHHREAHYGASRVTMRERLLAMLKRAT